MKSQNLKSISALLLGGAMMVSSCKKNEQTIEPAVNNPGGGNGSGISSGINIQSSIGGVIVDENDNPVSGAQVSLNGTVALTDVLGVFLFNNVNLDSKRDYVKVSKNGFFHGSRAFTPNQGNVTSVKIKLLSNASVGSFTSSTGGVISASGVSLTFPTDAVELDGGGAYTGTVNVGLQFLDPNSSDIVDVMPGDLMALNQSGDIKVLETFGMAAVELTGTSGQKLNVAAGKTVELKMPLSGPYLTDAPATIPLWYFDETNGVWKEEGSATLVGSEYVGDVSHFTFWNCDNPQPSTEVQGRIICDTLPMQGLKVQIKNTTGRILGSAYTDNNGEFDGFLPQNTNLTIIVSEPVCGGVLYTANIGPFNSPVTLADVIACPVGSYGTLWGQLVDCAGAPVTNGALNVVVGGQSLVLFPNSNGYVMSSLPYCTNTSLDVTGYDYTNVKVSGTQTISTGAAMSFGTLSVCNSPDEFIDYVFDGNSFSINNVNGSVDINSWGGETSIYGYNQAAGHNIGISGTGVTLGTHSIVDSSLYVNNNSANISSTTGTITYTVYGSTVGSYVEGNFNAAFTDQSAASHTISGSFRVKRP
jgi:hypothetical protein